MSNGQLARYPKTDKQTVCGCHKSNAGDTCIVFCVLYGIKVWDCTFELENSHDLKEFHFLYQHYPIHLTNKSLEQNILFWDIFNAIFTFSFLDIFKSATNTRH